MAQFAKLLVDIPDDKGVHTKSAGAKGEKYVYKYVGFFRNANGDPRNRAKAIGKLDPHSGRMYPNSRYFEMYHLAPSLTDISILDYGYSYLILKACRDTGLLGCLSQVFGKRAMDIVVMASYIIREGNAMDGIDDWQRRNLFPGYSRMLTSQITSRICGSFTARQREDFFKLWVEKALDGGSVCYDVTSVSSYAQQMPAIERGYNRDGDGLPQYNLGMFCNELTKIPIYYNRYNGSLTDRANLSYVLANAKAVGITQVKVVLDGGFWSEQCIKSLHGFCDAFTVGMPMYLKESKKTLQANGDGIEKYANALSTQHLYCVPVHTELHGVPGRVLVYYDALSRLNQCLELSNHINRLGAELETLKRYPSSRLNRYTPYFVLTKHGQGNGFDYHVDNEKIEKLRKTKGYFLLFSTDMTSSPQAIIDWYRAKDADEKLFAQIKVDMDGRRIRTHNEQTTDGKTFVTFIACVIRSYLLTRLSKYLTDYSTSMKKVFAQLSDILVISSNEGYRFTKALTKKQKQILTAFDAVDDILESLNQG